MLTRESEDGSTNVEITLLVEPSFDEKSDDVTDSVDEPPQLWRSQRTIRPPQRYPNQAT